jgi:hypothetical protein
MIISRRNFFALIGLKKKGGYQRNQSLQSDRPQNCELPKAPKSFNDRRRSQPAKAWQRSARQRHSIGGSNPSLTEMTVDANDDPLDHVQPAASTATQMEPK